MGANPLRRRQWLSCCPKDQGGLGIQDRVVENATFLGKWLFKLLTRNKALAPVTIFFL